MKAVTVPTQAQYRFLERVEQGVVQRTKQGVVVALGSAYARRQSSLIVRRCLNLEWVCEEGVLDHPDAQSFFVLTLDGRAALDEAEQKGVR